jgi:peptidoglycan hydrolase CwlO-like protein
MLKKSFVIVAAITCLLGLFGCGLTRKGRIESELKELRAQREASRQRLDSSKQKITSLQSESNKLVNELNANHNRTMALMRDNPGTVACIASGAIALSEGNVFSDDVKELGAKIGLVCLGFYIFSENFQQTADNLVNELNTASDRAENLQHQVDALKLKIDAETRSWQTEKKLFDELSRKIAELELELDKLTR